MKKNVVRGFALVLVILMCLSLLPLAARAEEHICHFEPTEIPPTCGTNGYVQMICPVCGNGGEILYTIPPTGDHHFEAIVGDDYLIEESDNICLKPSVYWKSCINYVNDEGAICGAPAEEAYNQAVQNLIDQLNARKDNGEQADWEALVKEGIAAIDEQYKFNYGGLGHDWIEYPGQECTCEQDGWTAYRVCVNCNETVGYEAIPAKGHRWGESTVVEPTCTEPGSETRVCEVCDKEEVREIPAKGHAWGEYTVTKEATCTEDGEKRRVCSVCGAVDTAVIPAAHKFGEYVVIEEPGCYASGTQEHTCTVCGYQEQETIPPAHKWGEYVVTQGPTCFSTGAEESTCSVCGEKEVRWIDMVPHRYENGECVFCHEPDPNPASENDAEQTEEKTDEELADEGEQSVEGEQPDEDEQPVENVAVRQEASSAETVSDFVNTVSEKGLAADDPAAIVVQNVTPLRDDGTRMSNEEVEELGGVTFEMPLPENYKEGDPIEIYHHNSETGEWELVPVTDFTIREGKAVIRVMHFSDFAIINKAGTDGAVTFVSDGSVSTGIAETEGAVTVVLDPNGGKGEVQTMTGTDGEKRPAGRQYGLPSEGLPKNKGELPYSCEGYYFAGWNTAVDGTGSSYGTVDDPYGTIADPSGKEYTFHKGENRLYAQWASIITVKFDPNGGTPTTVNEIKKGKGGTITIPTADEYGLTRKLGERLYKFTGWNLVKNGTKEDNEDTHFEPGDGAIVEGNATVYAEWVKPVTVKYMANGGTGYIPDDTTHYVGDRITLLGHVTSPDYKYSYIVDGEEYELVGWSTTSDGTDDFYEYKEENVELEDDLTLYAQWAKPLKVQFYANGGNDGVEMDPNPQIVPAEYMAKLNKNTYKKTGYAFTGWNTKENGSGIPYEDEDYIYLTKTATQPYPLYAQWEQTSFDLVFYNNDGSAKITGIGDNGEIKGVDVNDTQELPDHPDTGTDDKFMGWSLTKDSLNVSYKAGDGYSPKAEDSQKDGDNKGKIVFYAVFKPTVEVTFIYRNVKYEYDATEKVYKYIYGTTYDSTTRKYPSNTSTLLDSFEALGIDAPDGFYFSSWNTKPDGSGDTYSDGQSVSLKKSTLYAMWAKKKTEPLGPPTEKEIKVTKPLINYYSGDEALTETLNGHPGTITINAANAMQWYGYDKSGVCRWIDISNTSTTMTAKSPASYEFRYKGGDGQPPSDSYEVEVKSYISVASDPTGPVFDAAKGKIKYTYDVSLYEVAKNGVKTKVENPADFPDEEVYFLLKYPSGISKDNYFLTLIHNPDTANEEEIDIEQLDSGILGHADGFSPFELLLDERLQGLVTLNNYAPKAGETITATVTAFNADSKLQYRWLRDGTPITDSYSNSNKYTVTAADLEHTLTCEVKDADGYPKGTIKSAETLAVDISLVENTSYKESAFIGYFEGVVSGMQYRIDGGMWVDVPGDGTLSGNRLYVKKPGTYEFRYKPETDSAYWAGPFELEGWYIVGYEISNNGTDSTGSGTVTFKNGSTTLTSSTNIKDSAGNVIIQAYDTHLWKVRIGATTNITMTVKPASSNYAHVRLNGGSYNSFNTEKTFTVSPVNQHKIYTIVFNKSSSSPQTGDMSNLGLWSALCLVSFVGAVSILGETRRRRKAKR